MLETLKAIASLPLPLRHKLAAFCGRAETTLDAVVVWEHCDGSGSHVLAATDGHRLAFLEVFGSRLRDLHRESEWSARCAWSAAAFSEEGLPDPDFDTTGVPPVMRVVPTLAEEGATGRIGVNGRYLAQALEFCEAAALAIGALPEAQVRAERETTEKPKARAVGMAKLARAYRKSYAQTIVVRTPSNSLDPLVVHDTDEVSMVVTMPIKL